MRILFSLICFFIFGTIINAEIIAPNGSQPLANYRTSWIGNSFGGMKDGKGCWVQQDITAMCVTPDGTVYTNVPWEEGGGNCSMYKEGKMLGSANHTHGWGFNGGSAVAANEKYVFIALSGDNENGGLNAPDTWPPKGFKWYGVSRRLRNDFTKGAPFEHGKGGKGDTLPKSYLVVNEVPIGEKNDHSAAITGLWADNERLFVGNPHTGKIEIYDAETMVKQTEWSVPEGYEKDIRQIACDADGNLWVLVERPREALLAERFLVFDKTGTLFSKQKSDGKILHSPIFIPKNLEKNFPNNYYPSAFCFDSKGQLLVADAGMWQMIFLLEKKDSGYVFTLDTLLGYPAIGRKMNVFGDITFRNITAIGADAQGSVYVASDWSTNGGGTILESYILTDQPVDVQPPFQKNFSMRADIVRYLSRWKLNWRLFGLCFIDCATLDPDDETVAFTKEERFKLDFSKPVGEEAIFSAGTAFKLNPRFKTDTPPNVWPPNDWKNYFRDPRQNLTDSAGVWVRNLDGKKFLFVNDMNGRCLQVYQLNFDNEHVPVTPAVLFAPRHIKDKSDWLPGQPEQGEWIWRNSSDTNQLFMLPKEFSARENNAPPIEGWWVDSQGDVWQATLKDGIRRFRFQGLDKNGYPIWNFDNLDIFPHPLEFKEVKRIRYDITADTLYLGGCAVVDGVEHKNQHWKPMGAVVCRYDNFLKGKEPGKTDGKLRWKTVLPYVAGSSGHESCEPMGFDIAGDYLFAPYTGASKEAKIKTGHIEIYRLDDGKPVGWMEPDPATVGEVGLQDMRECLSAHRLKSGEYIIFLEDDYKAKVVMFRWKP